MIKLYGIPTCGSVKKARKFFKDNGIEVEFIDFKKSPVDCAKIDEWLEKTDMKTLFNKRGTKYRMLKLKELDLDESGQREWLCKENMLIKRPVIEQGKTLTVGFDEQAYQEKFL